MCSLMIISLLRAGYLQLLLLRSLRWNGWIQNRVFGIAEARFVKKATLLLVKTETTDLNAIINLKLMTRRGHLNGVIVNWNIPSDITSHKDNQNHHEI